MKESEIYQFDDDRNTNLHIAASLGYTNDVLKYLENGHKINLENDYGWTPLMMAARNGHLDTIKLLLNRQSDATWKNKFGASIFLMAVACGNLDIIHIILEHLLCGGVSKQSMEATFSPISISIIFKHEHVFKYLLGKSFNLNSTNMTTDLTPLKFAAINTNKNYTKILLSNGANPNDENKCELTGTELALVNKGISEANSVEVLSSICAPHIPPQMALTYQNMAMPYIFVNQQPSQFIVYPTNTELPPDMPNYCFNAPPVVTPITPVTTLGYYPQIFFPSEFSPAQVFNPFSFPGVSPGYILSPNSNIPSPNLAF